MNHRIRKPDVPSNSEGALTTEQDNNRFGYRFSRLSDGRVELIDAPSGMGCNGYLALLVGGVFVVYGLLLGLAATGVPFLQTFGLQDGGAGRWPVSVLCLGIGGFVCAIGAQLFVRRPWTIESSAFARRTELMGIPLGWQRTQRLERIDINHAIWQDGKGVTDSVTGVVGDPYRDTVLYERFHVPTIGYVFGTTAFFSHPELVQKPKVGPTVPVGKTAVPTVEDEVTPRVWWLGHWLAGGKEPLLGGIEFWPIV